MSEGKELKTTYKKISVWQWVLIYFGIAIIIYGLTYYFMFARGESYYRRPPNLTQSSLPNRTKTISFREKNTSSESGNITLKQDNGVFTIEISLKGEPSHTTQPADIYMGKCPNLGAVKYILNPVSNDSSITSLQLSFDQVKKQEPLAVAVHTSKQDLSTSMVCTDINL